MTTLYKNRTEAGRQLARALGFLGGDRSVLVLAIPRGGVPVAREIADSVGAPLDVIIVRKIGAPGNPELAVGAVTQDGDPVIDRELVRTLRVPEDYLKREAASESAEVRRRLEEYRGDRPYPHLDGKTVVIVDDGVATGSTVLAAVQSAKRRGARSVMVAVPVGPRDTISMLAGSADRVVCLSTPDPFYAIGEFYQDFSQVADAAVKEILVASWRP